MVGNVAITDIFEKGGGGRGTAAALVSAINSLNETQLDVVATNPSEGMVVLEQVLAGGFTNRPIFVDDPLHWDSMLWGSGMPKRFQWGWDESTLPAEEAGFGCTGNYTSDDSEVEEGTVTVTDDFPSFVFGCIEPSAINFDPQASRDDGSCYFDLDGDGTIDSLDQFPTDANESIDTDADGIGDNMDADDDDDGWPDAVEGICQTDSMNSSDFPSDFDEDGTCDLVDTDDDNDGYADSEDDFPLDPNLGVDWDGDGIDRREEGAIFDRVHEEDIPLAIAGMITSAILGILVAIPLQGRLLGSEHELLLKSPMAKKIESQSRIGVFIGLLLALAGFAYSIIGAVWAGVIISFMFGSLMSIAVIFMTDLSRR